MVGDRSKKEKEKKEGGILSSHPAPRGVMTLEKLVAFVQRGPEPELLDRVLLPLDPESGVGCVAWRGHPLAACWIGFCCLSLSQLSLDPPHNAAAHYAWQDTVCVDLLIATWCGLQLQRGKMALATSAGFCRPFEKRRKKMARTSALKFSP